jgi:hypothetical protein
MQGRSRFTTGGGARYVRVWTRTLALDAVIPNSSPAQSVSASSCSAAPCAASPSRYSSTRTIQLCSGIRVGRTHPPRRPIPSWRSGCTHSRKHYLTARFPAGTIDTPSILACVFVAAVEPERKPTVFERRAERLALPPCLACDCRDTQVATRTEYVVYVRCPNCGDVWSVPKPGVTPFGS